MNEVEILCMKMISMSGSAKTKYIQAVDAAHDGCYEKALELLEQGKKELEEGYKPHLQMLQKNTIERNQSISLLLAHAEDQLSGAELLEVVCKQMIYLYQRLDEQKG